MDVLCTQCAFYIYDDYYRISEGHYKVCPYYRNGDEYLIVRKQN